MRVSPLLSLFTLFTLAVAHSTHKKRIPTPEEVAREEIRAREHVELTRNCEVQLRDYMSVRMRRRAALQRRGTEAAYKPTPSHTPGHPYYTTIQNTTCITAPEVLEGPYYVNNEYVRTDLRQSEGGIPLLMDFGIMDTTTCKPMDSAFLEIWHANATGVYSGYDFTDAITGTSGPVGGNFDGKKTALRGGWHADKYGMVEFSTIYPGFYDDRPPHIHLMVHKDMQLSNNGTFISHSGSVLHVAQIFFPDDWSDKVFATYPYTINPSIRVFNDADEFYPIANSGGYKGTIDIQWASSDQDVTKGLIGYLTLGVDSRANYAINNTHYNG